MMSKYFAHFVTSVFCVTLIISASAQEVTQPAQTKSVRSNEYPVVSRNHWACDALSILWHVKLNDTFLLPRGNSVWVDEAKMTRYEFAVVVARMYARIPSPRNLAAANFSSDSPTVTLADAKDALASLEKEFASLLSKLGMEEEPALRKNRFIQNLFSIRRLLHAFL